VGTTRCRSSSTTAHCSFGDAAGLGLNSGYTIRGMDMAIESGRLAAEAVISAHARDDFSAAGLASYTDLLAESFVGKDMRFSRRFPSFLEDTPRLFTEYPAVAEQILLGMFVVDGTDPVPLSRTARQALHPVGIGTVAKDAWRGLGAVDGRTSFATRMRGGDR